MSDEYTKYLNDLHSKVEVPSELLAQIVVDATSKELLKATRIIAGEANEVYGVDCEGGLEVIVRISRIEENEFEREAWAINQVHMLGVPVPEMLLIKDYHCKGALLHVCVQKRIAGDPLERGAIDYRRMSESELRPLIQDAGFYLSKIHSIRCDGFEYLDKNGKGISQNMEAVMTKHLLQYDEYASLARRVGMSGELLKKVFDILQNKAQSLVEKKPVINHGDFGPKHIMVHKGSVTGILDWGQVQGDQPHGDFARWDFWFDDIPLPWLQDGYADKTLFDESFNSTMLWISLNNSLGTLYYYDEQGYSEGVALVQHKMQKILDRI